MAELQNSQQSNALLNSSQNSVKSCRSNATTKSGKSKAGTKTEKKDAETRAATPAKRSRKKFTPFTAASSTFSPATVRVAKKPRQKTADRRSHPKYSVMMCEAIEELKERSGSSRQAILKYVMKSYNVATDEKKVRCRLNVALRLGLETGTLKQMKGSTGAAGSFKLADAPEEHMKKAVQKKARKSPTKIRPKVMKIAKKVAKKTSPKKAVKATLPKKTPKAKSPKKAPRTPKTARVSKSKPAKKVK